MKLHGITASGMKRIAQEVEERECPFYEPEGIWRGDFEGGRGWHWTDRASAETIIQEGLGTRGWTHGEHHASYMYCELPYEYQDRLDAEYGHPSEWTRDLPYGSRWYDEVEDLLREAYPDIHMSCLGSDSLSSRSYGDVAVVVDVEGMEGVVEGFSFSDTAFGQVLLTFGKIPREFLTLYDPEVEGEPQ